MSSKKKSSVAGSAGPAAAKGFMPDASLQPVSISQPKLDCSDAGLDGDQELWLLQLPLDFPTGSSVDWAISEHPAGGFRGRCTVQGVEYLLVPDEPALSADLFATPSSQHGAVVPVTRRMTVVRATEAPMLCFGALDAAGGGAAVTAPKALPPADKKALKRKKVEQQQQVLPAPVAPAIAAPRDGAAPATASKAGQAVPGAGGPRDTSAVAAAAAEQQQPATEKKKKKKQRAHEGEEGGAGDGSGKKKQKEKEDGEGDKFANEEQKKTKEKSAKRQKKKEKGDA